jgi:hypothetical protein
VSEAPKVEVVKKYHSHVELEEYKTDEQKKEEVDFCILGVWGCMLPTQ